MLRPMRHDPSIIVDDEMDPEEAHYPGDDEHPWVAAALVLLPMVVVLVVFLLAAVRCVSG